MAAALRASSSRRRSQAFALSIPAVRRAAIAPGRGTRIAEAVGNAMTRKDHPAAAAEAKAQHRISPKEKAKDAKAQDGKGMNPAGPSWAGEGELGPVRGTKRLCKRRDSEAAAALARVAEVPASLADSTQQEEPAQAPGGSPLPGQLGSDGPAAAREESPVPDWLCNDAPGQAPEQPAKVSVSPLWLMDSEEALPGKEHRPDAQQGDISSKPIRKPAGKGDLADPPSLAGGAPDDASKGQVSAGAGHAQSAIRSEGAHGAKEGRAVAGAWRSRGGAAQPRQVPAAAAAAKHKKRPSSQHTYRDTYR